MTEDGVVTKDRKGPGIWPKKGKQQRINEYLINFVFIKF